MSVPRAEQPETKTEMRYVLASQQRADPGGGTLP